MLGLFSLLAKVAGTEVDTAFITALLTGHWEDAGDLTQNATAVAGLIVGGLCGAPLAGYVVKRISPRTLGVGVGTLVLILVVYQTVRLLG